jgi:iron complex outermembrane receptor protein
MGLPLCAQAADIRYPINILAKPPAEALVELGLQTRSTIGGPVLCEGPAVSLRGDYSLGQALERILANSNCGYQVIDPRTARTRRITRRAAPTPQPDQPPPPPSPAPPRPDTQVEGLEVAAFKRPDYMGSVPGAVTIIGGRRIDDTSLVDTEALSRQAAAFATTNLGPARNKILVRGLSDGAFTGRTQSTVGTYLDDIPVTYNAPDPDLRLADVQNIEILRGPQGALYGGGSLSGVYRIVTRPPDLERTSAAVNLLGASTEGGAGSSEIDGVVNVRLFPEHLALRIVGYNDHEGGYLHDDALRLANVDQTKRSGGRAALLWKINDDWSATLSSATQVLRSADTQYVTVRHSRANQVRETHSNDFLENALAISGQGGWGRLRSTVAYVRHDFASRYDATSVLGVFGDPGDAIGIFDEGTANRMVVGDAYWSSPETGRWHFMAGGFGSGAVEDLPSELRSKGLFGPPLPLYVEDRRDVRQETALYGEATYAPAGGWLLSAGLRAFETEVHTRSMVTTPLNGRIRILDKSKTFQGVSPKFSIQKSWSPDLSVYALWSSGYRAGGFNSGGLAAPSASTSTFTPDRLQNMEIGGRYVSPDHRLKVTGALFYARWRDLQTDQYLISGISYTANVGDGVNIGLESDVSYQAGDHWLLQASALIDDPKITSLNAGFTGVVGARLPGVPKAAFSGLITYQTPLPHNRSFVLTGEGSYTGSSRLTFDPRYAPPTAGYYTANLTLQVVGEKAGLALLVSNPLNSSKDTFSYGNPFSFGQVRQATPQRPRTISLRLSRKF